MPQDPDSFGFLIFDINRLLRGEMDRRTAEGGLDMTSGERKALVQAARNGLCRQSALADDLSIEAMTVTGYLDRLEARALVERIPDPEDRRAKLVRVTEAGHALLERMAPIGSAMLDDIAGDVRPEQWAATIEALKTVRTNLARIKACAALRKRDAA